MKKDISVIIFDLDNTLYDWYDYWYYGFKIMVDKIEAKSGISRDIILRDFKVVHEQHGTSEYGFAIQELSCLKEKHPNENLGKVYEDAIEACKKERKKHLRLYPGVMEDLRKIKKKGSLIVG